MISCISRLSEKQVGSSSDGGLASVASIGGVDETPGDDVEEENEEEGENNEDEEEESHSSDEE